MCLILFAYKSHPHYDLIVAANRDEFYKRPTKAAHFWEDRKEILAGRDLEQMGTWMGVTKSGRFSALTNFRDLTIATEGKRSRGELVSGALEYEGNLQEYMSALTNKNSLYPGYNLLAGDRDDLYYYSNMNQELQKLEPGIYGVSNHLLNTNWPKVIRGKEGLSEIISKNEEKMVEELFQLLKNTEQAPDQFLPATGVSLELERMLSPLFIESADYGTRSSTVLLRSNDEIHYIERVYMGGKESEQSYTLKF